MYMKLHTTFEQQPLKFRADKIKSYLSRRNIIVTDFKDAASSWSFKLENLKTPIDV